MKLAVVGKGGAGKSALAGTIARAWGRSGTPVLAVDLDPNPGLALSLGVPLSDEGLPGEAVEAAEGVAYGHRLRAGLTAAEAVELYAARGPDGVRFLQVGNIDRAAHSVARNVVAIRGILRSFDAAGWNVLGDLEAGPTTPFEGYMKFAQLGLIVVEPTAVSLLTARRLAAILEVDRLPFVFVANQVRSRAGEEAVGALAAELGTELLASVPHDPAIEEADRLGVPPIDHAPTSAGVGAMIEVARLLSARNGAVQ